MKKYKTTLSWENLLQMRRTIATTVMIINENTKKDYDLLMMAALWEVVIILKRKEVDAKPKYTLTFTPVQALAISFFYTRYTAPNYSDQFHNRLMQMSNEILQLYGI